MNKNFYIYILTNKHNKILYIGVTNNLKRRVFEHKSKQVPGFTKRYNCEKLVYYEQLDDPENAIIREKQLKSKVRSYKIDLINRKNEKWEDLYYKI